MENKSGFEIPGSTDNGTTGWTALRVFFIGLLHNRRTASPMNCSVTTTAASQRSISGIDDCVDFLVGNIAADQFDPATVDVEVHGIRDYKTITSYST